MHVPLTTSAVLTVYMQAKLILHTAGGQGHLHSVRLDICTQLSEWTLQGLQMWCILLSKKCGFGVFCCAQDSVTSVMACTSPGTNLHWISLLSSFMANQVLCLTVLMPGTEHAWKPVSLQHTATPQPMDGQTLN